jgi:hypothetical protein
VPPPVACRSGRLSYVRRSRAVLLACLLIEACGGFGSNNAQPVDAGVAGDGGGEGGARPKVVFISRKVQTPGGGAKFVTDANALCTEEASLAGLKGNFVAWLSDSNQDAITKLGGNGPWALPSGQVVFANRQAVFTAQLQRPISEHADTNAAPPASVWTGTKADGTSAGSDCLGWAGMSDIQFGMTGLPARSDAQWTEGDIEGCTGARPFICFEL